MAALTDLLLTRDLRPEGPKRVSITIRPQRIAYFVDPEDSLGALAAIESACLTWGGVHNFLIPCMPGARPDPLWNRVLEIHDPDAFLDLVGADPVFIDEQSRRWDRHTHRWDNPTTTMELVGAVVFSSLAKWKDIRPPDQSYVSVNLHPLAGHALALPLAFRHGHLDPRPMDQRFVLNFACRAARHDQFVDIYDVDPSALDEQRIIRLVTEVPLDMPALLERRPSELTDWCSLPALTASMLPSRQASYYWRHDNRKIPEYVQHDEAFYSRIIVVGLPDSVSDLCLAWNIRAQRSSAVDFPLWVAPDWLKRADVLEYLSRGRAWVPSGLSEDRGSDVLHFVSATIPPCDLAALIPPGLANVVVHDGQTLDHFFSPDFHVGPETDTIVNFRDGVAEIGTPDYLTLGQWSDPQRLG